MPFRVFSAWHVNFITKSNRTWSWSIWTDKHYAVDTQQRWQAKIWMQVITSPKKPAEIRAQDWYPVWLCQEVHPGAPNTPEFIPAQSTSFQLLLSPVWYEDRVAVRQIDLSQRGETHTPFVDTTTEWKDTLSIPYTLCEWFRKVLTFILIDTYSQSIILWAESAVWKLDFWMGISADPQPDFLLTVS